MVVPQSRIDTVRVLAKELVLHQKRGTGDHNRQKASCCLSGSHTSTTLTTPPSVYEGGSVFDLDAVIDRFRFASCAEKPWVSCFYIVLHGETSAS